ncbi:MAG: sugar phosphate nucleotidyltransferase [Promethearchaeota archaeon]
MLPLKNELRYQISVIILCAGEGIRFKEITKNLPKPLLKVKSLNNIEILYHTINNFVELGLDRIVVIKGHLGNQIEDFISSLKNSKKFPLANLLVISSGEDYKLGSLFSFLSITKNNVIFKTDTLFLVIPGDTIFEFNLLKEIIIISLKNFNLIQAFPIAFYREMKVSELKEKHKNIIQNSPKSISIAQIERQNSNSFLKKIQKEDLRVLTNDEQVRQLIPIFIFNYNLVNEFLNLKGKVLINSIWETINHVIKNGEKVIAFKIDKRYQFYDIDTELDLLNFNMKKKKDGQ